ncbi:MAG: phosphate acyltransferase PlsX [Lentisphaerae bacterium]|jgi:glycerol-3-phosphate acyltransferase PlsX|nr:phosphate acyltransferase PlsX [Lentisphaerota bacterium]
MSNRSSQESTITVAVDAMGGDYAPSSIVDGVGLCLDAHGDAFRILIVGDKEKIEMELRRIGKFGDPRVEVVHASQVVEMDDHPVSAVRSKRDSSINVAMNLVREGRACGVFSAGNTGATVISAYFRLSMLPGIERPGIAAVLPSETGNFLLLDAGASVDCAPINLLHYGIMGSIYSKTILQKENPRVGVMCNGTEEGKGNKLTQAAVKLLAEAKMINFIGNVEGHDLFSGNVDVVVCDGFVGNVILKSAEQLAKSMGKMIKQSLMSKLTWKLGALISKGAFKDFRKRTDYSEVGGAPLLGVKGVVIIGHGISDGKAVMNGIRAVGEAVKLRVNKTIEEQVKEYETRHNGG